MIGPATRCPRPRAPLLAAALLATAASARAQPTMIDPNLMVSAVVPAGSLDQPTTMAFLQPNEFLVLEKATGIVRRILNDALHPTVALDVAVHNTGESGLLGIAVDPGTPTRVFLYYTEALMDGGPPLGNRLYRYDWNAATGTLVNPQLLLDLAANQSFHAGGVLVWDDVNSHLYAVIGDQNHTGQLQNIANGPPPDNTGVIFRINADGTPAAGNPFTPYCSNLTTQTCTTSPQCPAGGTCLTQVARYYSYGVRNCFGMTRDPVTGLLWDTENGPFMPTYDEVDQVTFGANSGWNRIMGPVIRDPQGTSDLWNMPGSGLTYNDPEFSWLDSTAPTGIAFTVGSSWGPGYDQTVLVGDAIFGAISAFTLNPARDAFILTGGLADQVADTPAERDQVRIGTGFNGITHILRGLEQPNPHIYVVSINNGTVYRIRGPLPVSLQGFTVE